MTPDKWPVGDPVCEPLFRDLVAAVTKLLACYESYCIDGIAKLEEAANRDRQP
jgi:hypothetical protein